MSPGVGDGQRVLFDWGHPLEAQFLVLESDPKGRFVVASGDRGTVKVLFLDGSPARRYQFDTLEIGMHGARALDGTLTFDVERPVRFRNEVKWWFDRLMD